MKSRIIQDRPSIDAIINKCQVCNMAMVTPDGMPYVIPMNFSYHEGKLYMHSGPEGLKLDILHNNPNVCVSFSSDHAMYHQHETVACSYSMKYKSVLIKGHVTFFEAPDKKKEILNSMMQKYAGKSDFTFSKPAINNVCVFQVNIDSIEGKAFGY